MFQALQTWNEKNISKNLSIAQNHSEYDDDIECDEFYQKNEHHLNRTQYNPFNNSSNEYEPRSKKQKFSPDGLESQPKRKLKNPLMLKRKTSSDQVKHTLPLSKHEKIRKNLHGMRGKLSRNCKN